MVTRPLILVQKYRHSTSSGSDIASNLGVRIYTPFLTPKNVSNVTIINWGLSRIPWLPSNHEPILNHPESVKASSNKLLSFRAFEDWGLEGSYPPFTTSKEIAQSWSIVRKVVCRTILTGSSGDGIVIVKKGGEVVDAPLYTLYIEKKWEFRVHVFKGKVIHLQQKRRLSSDELEKRGITLRNKYIRNLSNGYIFSSLIDMESSTISEMEALAIKSMEALSLDFGGIDIVLTADLKPYLLEVNSAPGLEGATLDKYLIEFNNQR